MGESPGEMYALAAVLTFLAVMAVALRLYARRIKKQLFEWDDFMILFALVGPPICCDAFGSARQVLTTAAAILNLHRNLHVHW